ncbi:hypothetical protein EJ05DRAFT_501122 [Pseudovirgaria hyperparasitica]|uniref:Uncharacterized protein n=1 Tax=Pseudovirgaria hyperparasitica TaxID=470096 RepID=A0A6A6W920_9PEZI|nr:uncharacterized protein EJ05DRAFT_501122 [Pseudovirgaria hyperparasitica]KAF2757591.1 hypothetical protein EJ05DRAFT_501122 [Pseudovirgaria hyperparasitica]
MYSRSASVASIPRLRTLRDANDEEKQSHRRSWSLGPFARKSKPSSRPSSIFLLRRNTERASELDHSEFNEHHHHRPHSWLGGSGIDVSRAQAWSSRRLPQTTYVDPTYASDAAAAATAAAFPEPPTTPPPNSNGVVDSHLGVLPSPAPTSIHKRSWGDLRNMEDEPPLPDGAQDRILRSVMRHASLPVSVEQLQAVQGVDPATMTATADEQPNHVSAEEDPDRTLTENPEIYDELKEFKKEIEDGVDGYESSIDSGSDPVSDEIEIGTGVQARVINKDGEISPVGTRPPTIDQRRASLVSPISDSDRNQERDQLLAERQREQEQIALQNSYGLEKEMNVREEEVDSSSEEDDEPTPDAGNMTGHFVRGASADATASNLGGQSHLQDPDEDDAVGQQVDTFLHDGSSTTAVDEDETPQAPTRFSFEDDNVNIENGAATNYGEANAPTHVQRTDRNATQPPHIQIPLATQQPSKSGVASDDDSSAGDSCSLPGDIVLTPTVQASQNPTPIFDRPPQFEDQHARKPSPLSLAQEFAPPPPPVVNGPPMITKREVRRDSPLNGYDAVPGAQLSQAPRRQGALLQALSNAVVNGSSESGSKPIRTEGYAVRVVAAPEPPRLQNRPPLPPPKDTPIPVKPLAFFQHIPKVQTSNIRGLDVTIPSPSFSFKYDAKDELPRLSTPPRAPQRADPTRSFATPPQNDETLIGDDTEAPSSIQRHKSDVEAAMVPLALHPAIRNTMKPGDKPILQQNGTSMPGLKSQQNLMINQNADNASVASLMSDDDLYGDHGGVVPPPSNQIHQGQTHAKGTPTITTHDSTTTPGQSHAPSQSSATTQKTTGRHRSKDSLGVQSLASWTNRTSKDDRQLRSSIDSADSRPMSFVTLPRDGEGKTIERVSTITRKERQDREDLVARNINRNQEPKTLKPDEQEQRSSFGQLAVHQQMGPQHNDFRQTQEPAREEDIPVQRQPTQRQHSAENGFRTPSASHPPIAEEPAQHDPIEPDIAYQPGPSTTSPKGGKPRHTPIVPIDPSQEHVAYQLSGYREATKKALELKLQADPNFRKENEEPGYASQGHRMDKGKEPSRAHGLSFFTQDADRFKLKGKAIGVFKVLGRPSAVQEITPMNGHGEPRPSNGSAGSSSSAVQAAHRMSFQTPSNHPDSGNKKNRFSMKKFLQRDGVGSYNSPNALKAFKSESKVNGNTTNDGSAYQAVRQVPPSQAYPERSHTSHSMSGRTSRQSDKYGEGNLLREDMDDEEDEELDDEAMNAVRGNSFVKSSSTLGPIHENQLHPGISPVETFSPHHNGRTPSPMDKGIITPPEPKYDDVPLPAAYDRSFRHINDQGFQRPLNPYGPLTPPGLLSTESPTWRRDPRDPFRGPSTGPPRKFSSDSYAAHVKPDPGRHNRLTQPMSPPLVSPLSSPPAHKKLFGSGLVGAAIGAAKFGETKKSKAARNSKDGGQQERPWAITLPNGVEEEEEHRMQMSHPKASQILGAPVQTAQQMQGPPMHPQASGPPPGFLFANNNQAPQPPPGFRFAAPHEQPPQHPAQHPQHPIHQIQNTMHAPPAPRHPLLQGQTSSPEHYQQQPTHQVPQHMQQQQHQQQHPDGQSNYPSHHAQQPSPHPSRPPHQPPLPGYREVLPREVQHSLSPIPQSAVSTEHIPRAPSVKMFPLPPNHHHSPSPPLLDDKHTPSSAPPPPPPTAHPLREEVANNIDGPTFLTDPTPANSAHPSRESGSFDAIVPGQNGVPAVPDIRDAAAAAANPPTTNRMDTDAQQVDMSTNPRASPEARQILPPPPVHTLTSSPTTTSSANSHENDASVTVHTAQQADSLAAHTSSPALSGGLGGVGADADADGTTPVAHTPAAPGNGVSGTVVAASSKVFDAPEGIAELSAVPKGEEEDEPVMFAASYPGMEWMPTWEGD